MDQGIAFCPECRAPQIRVILPEPVPEPVLPEFVLPEDVSVAHPVTSSTRINWSLGIRVAAIAGFSASVLVAILQGALGIAMITAGLLSVLLYSRRSLNQRLTSGMGFRLGLVSGAIGFAIITVFTALKALIFGVAEMRATMMEAIQKAAAMNADPNAQQAYELLQTPVGLAVVLVLGMMVLFVISIALSGIGGAIGGAFSRRRNQP